MKKLIEEIKIELTGKVLELLLKEATQNLLTTANSQKAIGNALLKVGTDYIKVGVVKNERINPFITIDDVDALIEDNCINLIPKGVIAVIEGIGKTYRVIYHYGHGTKMLVKSGEMGRENARDFIIKIVDVIIKEGIKPNNIEVYVPFENFTA